MRREVDIEEIWDGKFYAINDMVKAECNSCEGCSACCRGMGNSILLDPLDIFHITVNLNQTFEQLVGDKIELTVRDGVILPNLKMTQEYEACSFLNEEGRCTIHGFRPGICRIFPLGRHYSNNQFQYFLQVHECKRENRTKVKVKKWIDTPDLKSNEHFILQWHDLVRALQNKVQEDQGGNDIKALNMYVLNLFFVKLYDKNMNFYHQFSSRLQEAKAVLQLTQ